MTDRSPLLTALVLAGGASRRMGADKRALLLDGRALLDRALALAAEVADEVLLLPGAAAPAVSGRDCAVVADWPSPAGPLGALGAGLEAARHPWCLLLPCDMPFVTPAVIDALRQQAAAAAPDIDAVVLTGERGPEPFCALYRTGHIDDLAAAVADGVDSLRGWLERLHVTTLDAQLLDATLRVLTNVNTPADLAEADQGSGSGVTA